MQVSFVFFSNYDKINYGFVPKHHLLEEWELENITRLKQMRMENLKFVHTFLFSVISFCFSPTSNLYLLFFLILTKICS